MAAQGVELATAWVRLVPSMEGATDAIVKSLAPGVKAAEREGTRTGRGWSAGTKKAMVAGGALAVAGTVAAFKGLWEIGSTFEGVTNTIRVGTGLQGDALDGLVDVAKNVGKRVPAEFDNIGSVVADLNTRLGLSGETMETVAAQYLEAGRILGTEVDINRTSAAFSAFKIEGDSVIGAMDDLFRVSQATGVGMNELADGVAKNAPALTNLGFGFQESISLLGSLDKAGINSQQVMSSLSRGLVTLAKDGEEPQEAFKRVTGEIQGFVDAGDTAAALDLASQVFGTRGASQFVGALQAGVLSMEDLMGATGATSDTILGVAEETQTLSDKTMILGNQAKAALEPIASTLVTGLTDALSGLMPTLTEFGSWLGENQMVIGIAAGLIGVTLVAAFVAWTASIWSATAALLANPLTWVVVAIVALVAAVVALATNWDAVVAWISDVWGGFIDWITGVIDGFASWWNSMWSNVGQFFRDTWRGFVDWVSNLWSGFVSWLRSIGDGIASWWNSLWSGVGRFFSDLWARIVAHAQNYLGNLRTNITRIGQGIANWWNNLWSGVGNFFRGLWDGLVNVVRNVGRAFSNVFNGIRDAIKTAFSGIVGIVKAPINAIIGLVNKAIGALNGLSVKIPDWVPGVGGSTFGVSLPKIPMLAKGATILPRSGGTLAVLAEAGRPESVVDTGLMNRALEEGLAGSRSSGVVVQGPLVQVDQMVVDSDDRVEEVAQALYERSERAARADGRINLEGAVVE